MKLLLRKNFFPFLLVWVALTCSACTGRTYLIVDYQVPDARPQLSGTTGAGAPRQAE